MTIAAIMSTTPLTVVEGFLDSMKPLRYKKWLDQRAKCSMRRDTSLMETRELKQTYMNVI